MNNFIANRIVTTDDRGLPWINNKIKSLIKNKTECFKNCVKAINFVSIRHFEHFDKILKYLRKSIISNFLENLQLIKSTPNVSGSY